MIFRTLEIKERKKVAKDWRFPPIALTVACAIAMVFHVLNLPSTVRIYDVPYVSLPSVYHPRVSYELS